MSEEERRLIERLEREAREPEGLRFAVLGWTTLFFTGVGALVGSSVGTGLSLAGAIAKGEELKFAGTGGVVTLALMLCLWRASQPARHHGLERDRLESEVELVHIQVVAAARAGSVYYLDLGEGKVLVLQGQYLRATIESGQFPNRDFTIVKSPDARISLRVECRGEPLPLAELREPLLEYDARRIPDGAIVSGQLASLKDDLHVFLTSGAKTA
jgi:hypothetical protein